MLFEQSNITADHFLAAYWQKKPLLIRQAFPGFTPELDGDDIAGLACDEMAESRMVTGSFPRHDWNLRYGPFGGEDFLDIPDTNWTLLVQDVEKHYPPLQKLMRYFDFLPRWRIDDLMVSVAGPGGSVGPHVDQYDVFLLQAEGSRRWEIAESFDSTLLPDCELNVLRDFSPEQEWVLEPGDLLYLPPGVAHHGVALDAGMTWSVGMRAPSAADLFQAYGEWLAARPDEGGRYRDSGLQAAANPGEIDSLAIARIREIMGGVDHGDRNYAAFIGEFLSRYRLAHEPAPPDRKIDPAALANAIAQGAKPRHNPWTRLFWIESNDGARIFAAGAAYSSTLDGAKIICDPDRLENQAGEISGTDLNLVCELLNRGHLYLEQL
jgi:50S ribosomal protein L16 3-hydroxylase